LWTGLVWLRIGRICGMNGKKRKRVLAIGRRARGKETTRKTET
jgi:hypothetical protein